MSKEKLLYSVGEGADRQPRKETIWIEVQYTGIEHGMRSAML
jgi:hypothetical protein